jgi:hypothetical protein
MMETFVLKILVTPFLVVLTLLLLATIMMNVPKTIVTQRPDAPTPISVVMTKMHALKTLVVLTGVVLTDLLFAMIAMNVLMMTVILKPAARFLKLNVIQTISV